MDYARFREEVKMMAGSKDFQQHCYLLATIHSAFRTRYVHTLGLGFAMREAMDHISKANKLPDDNYNRYINYFHYTRSMQQEIAV